MYHDRVLCGCVFREEMNELGEEEKVQEEEEECDGENKREREGKG